MQGCAKILGECFFEAALLPNQKMLPCVRYEDFKLWVSINHVRYRKNVRLFFVQVLLCTSKVGRTDWVNQFKDKQPNYR